MHRFVAPSKPLFFCGSLLNRFLSKIYICIFVYTFISSLSFSLSLYFSHFLFGHDVDRPPNARVLRTDIRNIKELLTVRIWSRWVAGVRRQNQTYRYFIPTRSPGIPATRRPRSRAEDFSADNRAFVVIAAASTGSKRDSRLRSALPVPSRKVTPHFRASLSLLASLSLVLSSISSSLTFASDRRRADATF